MKSISICRGKTNFFFLFFCPSVGLKVSSPNHIGSHTLYALIDIKETHTQGRERESPFSSSSTRIQSHGPCFRFLWLASRNLGQSNLSPPLRIVLSISSSASLLSPLPIPHTNQRAGRSLAHLTDAKRERDQLGSYTRSSWRPGQSMPVSSSHPEEEEAGLFTCRHHATLHPQC